MIKAHPVTPGVRFFIGKVLPLRGNQSAMPRNPDRETTFHFKRFDVVNRHSAMKVGTDGVLLGAWAGVAGVRSAVDAGCGTGLIALMLAQRGVVDITAVDIDPVAVDEASANVAASPWPEAVTLWHGDFIDWAAAHPLSVDLVVCNPPFFTETLRSGDNRRAAARHEGTLGIASLLEASATVLNERGRVALVSPASRENEIAMLAAVSRLYINRLSRVASRPGKPPKRLVVELSRSNIPAVIETLYINDNTSDFSDAYCRLVSDFYLNM